MNSSKSWVKIPMARKLYKFKLLLDEGFHLKQRLPNVNSRFDLKHVAADYHLTSLPDSEVHELAKKEHRLVLTYNIKHFKELAARSSESGIIGVSPNLPLDQIDKKLTALLVKSSEKELFGKLTTISEETTT